MNNFDFFAWLRRVFRTRNPWERGRIARLADAVIRETTAIGVLLGYVGERFARPLGWVFAGAAAAAVVLFSFSATKLVWRGHASDVPVGVDVRVKGAEVGSAEDFDALVAQTATILQAKDYGAVRAKVERLLALRPGDARSQQMLGALLVGERRFEEARVALQESVRLAPDDKVHRFNLAEVEFLAGNFGRAAELFESALHWDRDNQDILLRLYLCYDRTARRERLEEIYGSLPPGYDSPARHAIQIAKCAREKKIAEARNLAASAELIYGSQEMRDYFEVLEVAGRSVERSPAMGW